MVTVMRGEGAGAARVPGLANKAVASSDSGCGAADHRFVKEVPVALEVHGDSDCGGLNLAASKAA